MKKLLKKLIRRTEGQSLVEYALIIALVAVALIVGLGAMKDGISGTFDTIVASL
jgi:Flp pilus assembly pilin Flp